MYEGTAGGAFIMNTRVKLKLLQNHILGLIIMALFINYAQASDAVQKNVQNNSLVIIGASYAQHWNPQTLDGFRVINKGIGGQQTDEILARYETDVINFSPKVVIIWGFINDIFRSKPAEIESKLHVARKNIEAMVKMARDNNIQPVLATEVTITNPDNWVEHIAEFIGRLMGKESYQDYVNSIVIETNIWIKEMAAQNDIMVLDFQRLLSDEDGIRKRKYAKEDGSHLSPAAYQALDEYMVDVHFRH